MKAASAEGAEPAAASVEQQPSAVPAAPLLSEDPLAQSDAGASCSVAQVPSTALSAWQAVQAKLDTAVRVQHTATAAREQAARQQLAQYVRRTHAARRIQQGWRRWRTSSAYLARMRALVRIQSSVRASQLRRHGREDALRSAARSKVCGVGLCVCVPGTVTNPTWPLWGQVPAQFAHQPIASNFGLLEPAERAACRRLSNFWEGANLHARHCHQAYRVCRWLPCSRHRATPRPSAPWCQCCSSWICRKMRKLSRASLQARSALQLRRCLRRRARGLSLTISAASMLQCSLAAASMQCRHAPLRAQRLSYVSGHVRMRFVSCCALVRERLELVGTTVESCMQMSAVTICLQDAQDILSDRQTAAGRALVHAAQHRALHVYESARSQAAMLQVGEDAMQSAGQQWESREHAVKRALHATVTAHDFDVQAFKKACLQVCLAVF